MVGVSVVWVWVSLALVFVVAASVRSRNREQRLPRGPRGSFVRMVVRRPKADAFDARCRVMRCFLAQRSFLDTARRPNRIVRIYQIDRAAARLCLPFK